MSHCCVLFERSGVNAVCLTLVAAAIHAKAMCFLTRDPRAVGRMRLVILTRMEGRRMNEFVFRKGNPIGIQLFDAVAIGGAGAARDALQAAALYIRRDTLWTRFSSKTAKRGPSKEEFDELLRLVSSAPVADIDSRLPSILFDQGGEYCLDWRLCCKAMAGDSLFSRHWLLREEQSTTTQYLFYMTLFDEFLSLCVSKDGTLAMATLLWRDRNNEESTILAGQAFANYLIHYMWHNTI